MKNEIIGYVGSGEFTQEDAKKLTGINLAFGILHNDGTVEPGGAREKIGLIPQIRQWNAGLRIMLSMVQAERDAFTRCCADEGLRERAAANLAEAAVKYDLDGIDLDWEYPCVPSNGSAVSPDDKHNFTLFCAAIRKHLDAIGGKKYYLTIAAGADLYYVNSVEVPELMKYLDYINIMTYDLKCGFHALAGHHTQLFSKNADVFMNSCAQALELFVQYGASPDRLLMGAAFYSRKWEGLQDNENHGLLEICAKSGGYGPDYEILVKDYIDKNGYTYYWDDEAQAPYLFNGSTFLSFDDPRSLKAKAEYVKEKGYGGIFYWEHKCDGTRVLLDTLYKTFQDASMLTSD
nr:glycosyl hydrolase family 18 protein [uncultured Acetatifactor sp.]